MVPFEVFALTVALLGGVLATVVTKYQKRLSWAWAIGTGVVSAVIIVIASYWGWNSN